MTTAISFENLKRIVPSAFKFFFKNAIAKIRSLILFSFVAILIFMILNVGIGLLTGYHLITSQSEISGIYLLKPLPDKIQKNDLIVFYLPHLSWLQERHYVRPQTELIKHVGAVPGEYLFTRGQMIYSCSTNKLNDGCHVLGECLKKDSKGRPLSCQQWNADRIPENNYYMQSIRDSKSLDSRYYGLIPLSVIRYQASLLVNLNFLIKSHMRGVANETN